MRMQRDAQTAKLRPLALVACVAGLSGKLPGIFNFTYPPKWEGTLQQPCGDSGAPGCPSIGWEAAAENITATIKPYLVTTDKKMPIRGIFYGDELSGAIGVSYE
eukprot:SAG11_NODE_16257_length_553_cov_0.667401_2_plen_103_part_01